MGSGDQYIIYYSMGNCGFAMLRAGVCRGHWQWDRRDIYMYGIFSVDNASQARDILHVAIIHLSGES
jgi:hypothetical protein